MPNAPKVLNHWEAVRGHQQNVIAGQWVTTTSGKGFRISLKKFGIETWKLIIERNSTLLNTYQTIPLRTSNCLPILFGRLRQTLKRLDLLDLVSVSIIMPIEANRPYPLRHLRAKSITRPWFRRRSRLSPPGRSRMATQFRNADSRPLQNLLTRAATAWRFPEKQRRRLGVEHRRLHLRDAAGAGDLHKSS